MISIITIPFAILQVLGGMETVKYLSLFIILFTMVIIILVVPFIMLWLPSIFIDDVKVFEGLKNGAKAGLKNYWKLVLSLLAIYIPIIAYEIFCFDTIANGIIFTPGYLVILVLESIISIVVLPILFIIYKEYRTKQINVFQQL